MDESELSFSGEMWHWRGPSPFHFVTVPEPQRTEIADISREVTYGWGMIPVRVRTGDTEWETSLWPKDGGYIVPIKDVVRRAEQVDDGDVLELHMSVRRKH